MTSTKQTIKGSSMHNRTRRGIVWSLLVGAALTACTQDLNITNPNAPDSSNFWRTESDALAGINATYSGLLQRGTYGRWLGFAYDIRSDEGMSTSGWTELRQWNGFVQRKKKYKKH